MAMNHCGVLRKITGFLERQECGYWCLSRPRAMIMPASASALMTASLASPLLPLSSMTRLPSKPGASFVKRPSASTVKGMVGVDAARLQPRGVLHPDVEVLATVAGRGVHEARAVLVRDVIAGEQRDVEVVAAAPVRGCDTRDRGSPPLASPPTRSNASTFADFITRSASLSARM